MKTDKIKTPSSSIEETMQARGERMILLLKKSLGKRHFRYALGEGADTYSVYAEYKDESTHTLGSVPDFSNEREVAEGFCRLLSRILATPLSLEAIYEDSVTP